MAAQERTDQERADYVQLLGAEIRNRRLARGMSLRALAKELNLSGHGTLVDYEHGRRIPPEDLVTGCERIFQVTDGALRNLREKALAERANRKTEEMLQPTAEPPASEPAAPRPVRWWGRRWVIVTAVAAIVAGAAVGGWLWLGQPVSASSVRYGFEDGDQRWSPLWGEDKVRYEATPTAAYEGQQALQVTTTLASNDEDKSIGVTHGVESLRPGMKVTMYLRVPVKQQASIRFFVYNSKSDPIWAPETPGHGNEIPLPTDTDWTEYVWTVPTVDEVTAIGVEIYQWTNDPVTIWIDAVNW